MRKDDPAEEVHVPWRFYILASSRERDMIDDLSGMMPNERNQRLYLTKVLDLIDKEHRVVTGKVEDGGAEYTAYQDAEPKFVALATFLYNEFPSMTDSLGLHDGVSVPDFFMSANYTVALMIRDITRHLAIREIKTSLEVRLEVPKKCKTIGEAVEHLMKTPKLASYLAPIQREIVTASMMSK